MLNSKTFCITDILKNEQYFSVFALALLIIYFYVTSEKWDTKMVRKFRDFDPAAHPERKKFRIHPKF